MGTDGELVERLRTGDRSAFREVYACYETRIFRFLARLTSDRAVAQDLFQETWIAFARTAPRLEPRGDLTGLLFTIARNKFLNWRRWSLLDVSRLASLPREPEAGDPSGSDAAEELVAVERALARLPLASREVLLLVGVEGLDPSQAASILGVRADAVRQRLARARSRLAELLDAEMKRDPMLERAGLDEGEP